MDNLAVFLGSYGWGKKARSAICTARLGSKEIQKYVVAYAIFGFLSIGIET